MLLLIENIIGFFLLFALARLLLKRGRGRVRTIVSVLSALLLLPALSYSVYYLHLFDDFGPFYEFRSHAAANWYPAGLGWLAGWWCARGRWNLAITAVMLCFTCIPFLKMTLIPISATEVKNQSSDGIYRQSTSSTCGPAAVATLLTVQFNDPVDERTVAHAAHSTRSGTEVWYFAQYLRGRGYKVRFCIAGRPCVPAIAGTRYGNTGHFVALLGDQGENVKVADPLTGIVSDDLTGVQFTGFYMTVKHGQNSATAGEMHEPMTMAK